jgi:hypothetical protein
MISCVLTVTLVSVRAVSFGYHRRFGGVRSENNLEEKIMRRMLDEDASTLASAR